MRGRKYSADDIATAKAWADLAGLIGAAVKLTRRGADYWGW